MRGNGPMAPATAFGSTKPRPKAKPNIGATTDATVATPAQASAAITQPAAAPMVVPTRIIASMPKRAPIFTETKLPAIKPLALRCVWQVAQKVQTPIIGIGGIQSLDDVLEFLVAGASAVQIGTANFYNPGLSSRLVDELAAVLSAEKVARVGDIVGTLRSGPPAACAAPH